MDSEIAWDECVGDIQLDTNNLPPLNDLSTGSTHLPNIDLLDLFSFDAHNVHASVHNASPTAPVQNVSPEPAVPTAVASVQQPRLSTPPPSPPPSSSSTDVVSLSDCDSNSNSNSNLNTTNSQSSDKSPPSPSSSLRSTHTTKHAKQEVAMNIDFHHHQQQQQEPQQRLSKKQKQLKQKQQKQQLQQQQAMDSSSTISSPNSSTTSPSYSPTPTPVTTTPSSPSSSSSAQHQARKGSSKTDKVPEVTDQSQDIGELRTRLASAVAEATALRQRVASLSEDNRHLRAALDHANARLIAVAQAAAPATAQQPVMLGLAHVTSDVAQRLTGALTISDPAAHQPQHHHHHHTDVSPPMRKKRKRVSGAAATTMACVMFMWGALVGSPGWLSHSNSASRTQAALPGVWKGSSSSTPATNGGVSAATAAAAAGNGNNINGGGQWQPNCMRMLEQLPDGSGSGGANGEGEDEGGEGTSRLMKKAKIEPLMVVGNKMDDDEEEDDDEPRNGPPCRSASASPMIIKEEKSLVDVVDGFGENQMTVDLNEDKQALARIEDVHMKSGSAVATSVPRYSYVLCRDAHAALDNVKACTQRMKNGLACGEPHTISLILPASAAGLSRIDGDLNDTADNGNHLDLAEVQCSVTAVARIPRPNQTAAKKFKGDSLHQQKQQQKHGKSERHLHEHGHADAAAGLYGKVIAMVPETGTVIADA